MNYLRKVLPSNVSIGTGFVINKQNEKEQVTSQIDIIIYDNSIPILFSEGDFVIALPESVFGIIEIRSNPRSSEISKAIKKAHNNGEIIGGKEFFNGIFGFDLRRLYLN